MLSTNTRISFSPSLYFAWSESDESPACLLHRAGRVVQCQSNRTKSRSEVVVKTLSLLDFCIDLGGGSGAAELGDRTTKLIFLFCQSYAAGEQRFGITVRATEACHRRYRDGRLCSKAPGSKSGVGVPNRDPNLPASPGPDDTPQARIVVP